MTISTIQHRAARAIACDTCGAPAGTPCTGITTIYSHALRAHTFAAMGRPLPTAAVALALTQLEGQREDARSFLSWMDGAHEFRSDTFGNDMVLGVFRCGELARIGKVRRALLDLATAHGLLISAVESRGRGRHIVSRRGLAFHAAGGDLDRFMASWRPELAASA